MASGYQAFLNNTTGNFNIAVGDVVQLARRDRRQRVGGMGQSTQAHLNASAREAVAPFPCVSAHDPHWWRHPARLFTGRLQRCLRPLLARIPALRPQQCNMRAILPMKTANSTCVSQVQHTLTLWHSENADLPRHCCTLYRGYIEKRGARRQTNHRTKVRNQDRRRVEIWSRIRRSGFMIAAKADSRSL